MMHTCNAAAKNCLASCETLGLCNLSGKPSGPSSFQNLACSSANSCKNHNDPPFATAKIGNALAKPYVDAVLMSFFKPFKIMNCCQTERTAPRAVLAAWGVEGAWMHGAHGAHGLRRM